MRSLRRFAGAIVVVLSLATIIACVAGIVGIWICYPRVSEKVETISARLDAGLERVSSANQNVRGALERARADMAAVNKESADLGGGEKGRLASRTLRSVIQRQAARNIDDLGGRLATLSDAAVAVSSLLESFEELPIGSKVQADPDMLNGRAEEARRLSASLRKLEAALGDEGKETSSREVAATTSEVAHFLENCQATLDGWQSDLDTAREDLTRINAQIVRWQPWVAIALTILLAWVAAGQISLLAHSLKWVKRA